MSDPVDVFEMAAQRESGCPDCGERIRGGARITLREVSGEFVWVHANCPKPRPVCPKCFMEIPLSGECC